MTPRDDCEFCGRPINHGLDGGVCDDCWSPELEEEALRDAAPFAPGE